MRFSITVEDCCEPWELVDAGNITENISRTRIRCAGCGQVRVLTATSLPARTDDWTTLLEVVR